MPPPGKASLKFGSAEYKAFMAKRKPASRPTTGSYVPKVDAASPLVDASSFGDSPAGEPLNGIAANIKAAIPSAIWESARPAVESVHTAVAPKQASQAAPASASAPPADSAAIIPAAALPSTTKSANGFTPTNTTHATDRKNPVNHANSGGWKPEGFHGINSGQLAQSPTTVYIQDKDRNVSSFRVYHTIDGSLPVSHGHKLLPRSSWGGGALPSLLKNAVVTPKPSQFAPSDEPSDLDPPQCFRDMARDMGLISQKEYVRRSAPPKIMIGIDVPPRPEQVEHRREASRRSEPVKASDDPPPRAEPVKRRYDTSRRPEPVDYRNGSYRHPESSRGSPRDGPEVNRREQPAHDYEPYHPRYQPVHMRYSSTYKALYNEHLHPPERELRDEFTLRGLPIPSTNDLDDMVDALYYNDKEWLEQLLNLEAHLLSKLWKPHEVESFIHDSIKSGDVDYCNFGDLQIELVIKEALRLEDNVGKKAAKIARANLEDTFADMRPAALTMLKDIANAESIPLIHNDHSIDQVAKTIAEYRTRKTATADRAGREILPPYLRSRRENIAPISGSNNTATEQMHGAKRPRGDDEQNQVAKRLRTAPPAAPIQQASALVNVGSTNRSTPEQVTPSPAGPAASPNVSAPGETATSNTSTSSRSTVQTPTNKTPEAETKTAASTQVFNRVDASDPDALFNAVLQRGTQEAAKKKKPVAMAKKSRESKEKAATDKGSSGVRSGRVTKTKPTSSARRTAPKRRNVEKDKEDITMSDADGDQGETAESSLEVEVAREDKWLYLTEEDDDWIVPDSPRRVVKPKKTTRRRRSSTETTEGRQAVPLGQRVITNATSVRQLIFTHSASFFYPHTPLSISIRGSQSIFLIVPHVFAQRPPLELFPFYNMGYGPKVSAANLEPLGKRRVFGAQVTSPKARDVASSSFGRNDAEETEETALALSTTRDNRAPSRCKPRTAGHSEPQHSTESNSSKQLKAAASNSPGHLPSPPSTTKTANEAGENAQPGSNTKASASDSGTHLSKSPPPRARLEASARAYAIAQEWQAKIKSLRKKSSVPNTDCGPTIGKDLTATQNEQRQDISKSIHYGDIGIRHSATADDTGDEPSRKRHHKNGPGPRASDANLEPMGKRRRGFSPKPEVDAKIMSPAAMERQASPQLLIKGAAAEALKSQPADERITLLRSQSGAEWHRLRSSDAVDSMHNSSGYGKPGHVDRCNEAPRKRKRSSSSTQNDDRQQAYAKYQNDAREQDDRPRDHARTGGRSLKDPKNQGEAYAREAYNQHALIMGSDRSRDCDEHRNASNRPDERRYARNDSRRDRHHYNDVRSDDRYHQGYLDRKRSPADSRHRRRDRSASPRRPYNEEHARGDQRTYREVEHRPRGDYEHRAYDSHVSREYLPRDSRKFYDDRFMPAPGRDGNDRSQRSHSPRSFPRHTARSGYSGYGPHELVENHRDNRYRGRDVYRR
ncbi:hypothetical protein BU23DRAFT_595776 [Bimuria novae-zelandiae CBS 107.79]|uniref:Uncharacterized protein n=1 Tax=Bimuria novae-zelandiae CBS 107.79 TaxID=1447943 RepID=A0A6A5VPG5_9PLEO|nr:hypothetical protein BU23DRAFT_595776 [Bimuria novae-zelandiae CBS 107.79]